MERFELKSFSVMMSDDHAARLSAQVDGNVSFGCPGAELRHRSPQKFLNPLLFLRFFHLTARLGIGPGKIGTADELVAALEKPLYNGAFMRCDLHPYQDS
jgi:hypothetical protein